MSLNTTIDRFAALKILVVGDIMLDQFVYGDVNRISPESPVPVLSIKRQNHMLGGAGNVISNLNGLGVTPYITAVVGHDDKASLLEGLLQNKSCSVDGLVVDLDRPTTVKTRYIAQNQQLLRSDFEQTAPIGEKVEQRLLAIIEKTLPLMNGVILSDYGKGCLTPRMIETVINLAKSKNIPVLVDPKGNDYSIYRGATVVTPNRKELAAATNNHATRDDADVVAACEMLIAQSGIGAVIATRSEDGMTIVEGSKKPVHLRTRALEVFDVSGAGDTVIATVAAGLAAGADLTTSATLANIAGGIVVAKIGTASIRVDELRTGTDNENMLQNNVGADVPALDRTLMAPMCDWTSAREQVDRWRARGLKVGFTNGCFDILHAGHVNYLNGARMRCDRLVVGLNHDQSVKLLKGEDRPINNESVRANVIGGLGAIDMVVFFGAQKMGDDNTASDLIRALQPDIYFKGADYTIPSIPEAKIVQSYGGVVELIPLTEGLSTTNTLAKIKKVGAA